MKWSWCCTSKALVQEFDQLKPESVVYKQIGPVLVKQDQSEAKSNVDTRLEFITGEMFVISSVISQRSC